MTVQRPHIISCRLSDSEWAEFCAMCRKHRVTFQDMMRAMVIDAIVEEMRGEIDGLRRKQPQGCEDSAEAGEGCRAAT